MTFWWELHLRALLRDRRTVLAVIGLAVGVALVLAVAVLERETGRPFETSTTLVHAPAEGTLLQISPTIQSRLPADVADRVGPVDGVDAFVTVVMEPTPLLSLKGATGAVLVAAGGCGDAVLVIDPCRAAPSTGDPGGPGTPVSISAGQARDLGVGVGDPIILPGGAAGDAHVGWIRTGDDPAAIAAIVPSVAQAQQLLGRADTTTTAFVVVRDGVSREQVQQAVGDAGTVGAPQPSVPTALVTVRQTLNSMRIAGIVVGAMIAISTLLLALDARRRALATTMLVGASTRRLMVGFAVEGVLIGAVGGLIGLPLGHLAGAALVSQFGSALLEGTGATITTAFDSSEIGLALGAGIAAALVAVLLAGRSVVRNGILANLDGHVGGRATSRSVAWWLIPLGLVFLLLSGLVLSWFGQGKLPFSSGQGGLSLAVIGTILVTMAVAPRLARAIASALARGNGVTGLMARAEIDRLPVRVGAAVTVLAIGLALAVTFSSLGDLGTSTTADRFAATTAGGVLLSPQQPWDQREGSLSDATTAAVRATPGVTGVTERWRAIVSSPTVPRLVIAFDGPAGAGAVAVTDGSLGSPGQPLSLTPDQVALSQVAAGRLGARPGDRVELPTLTGPASFTVAAVFDPVAMDDSTVGDWALVAPAIARDRFGAVRSQLAVAADAPATVANELRTRVPGTVVLDQAAWNEVSASSWSRWFRPFTVTGYLIAAAGGIAVMNMLLLSLIQQRRTRATLRTVGRDAAGERRDIAVQAIIVGVLAVVIGVAWAPLMIWLLTLSSPVFYGLSVDGGLVAGPLLIGVAITVAFVAAALIAPLLVARRLDVPAALVAD